MKRASELKKTNATEYTDTISSAKLRSVDRQKIFTDYIRSVRKPEEIHPESTTPDVGKYARELSDCFLLHVPLNPRFEVGKKGRLNDSWSVVARKELRKTHEDTSSSEKHFQENTNETSLFHDRVLSENFTSVIKVCVREKLSE